MKTQPIPRSREDIKRLEFDDELDGLLKTESGRKQAKGYFDQLSRSDSKIALLKSTLHLPGDVIECGVFRGMSLRRIGLVLAEMAPEKNLYGLDSFEGFPRERIGRVDLGFLRFMPLVQRKFRMCNDTPERLARFFQVFGIRGRTVRGFFQDTLPQFANQSFCFIHLDCDIYESYRECLAVLYDRLVPGGVVVFDDYRSPKWPGAAKAVDEFFANSNDEVQFCAEREQGSWFVRKRSGTLAREIA